MTKEIDLSNRIHDFLKKYAKTAANFDPEYDEECDRFNGPDSAILYGIAECLKHSIPFQSPFSSWGSGCYKNIHDNEGRKLHDSLLAEINNLK